MEDKIKAMLFPSKTRKISHLLKPCSTSTSSIDGSEAFLPPPPDLKTMSSTVRFAGWRLANKKFITWAQKMAALHKPTWEKAGIYEAVSSSAYNIIRDRELVLGITERWCPDTNTFVFPWGETSITLEDVMVLLGFSVLGLPIFASLDSEGEEIKERLEKEYLEIRGTLSHLTQLTWMDKYMNSNHELEHVAFLVCWLGYFVFPLYHYHIYEDVFPVAIHLSIGNKIALAPAVLAHLYADLTLLKKYIQGFHRESVTVKAEPSALFKLVQVWTWERFKKLQPKPNKLDKGDPRIALWHEKQRKINDVRRILDNSNVDSFEWRPYTKPLKNWDFPRFYPDREMLVPVSPSLDDEFTSFARCVEVSKLVGVDYMVHYFPDRVAKQFGMLQDVPSFVVNRKNLSHQEAWDHYNKPIRDSTLYIPSRSAAPCATPAYSEWWKEAFQNFQSYLAKMRVFEDDTSLVASRFKKRRRRRRKDVKKTPCYKRHKYMTRENNESSIGRYKALLSSDSDDEDDDSITVAQKMRQKQKRKYIGVMSSEVDDSVTDMETEQNCDDELGEHGSNAEMIDGSSEEPNVLLKEDGLIAGEKASSEEKLCEADSVEEEHLALKANNNEPTQDDESYKKSVHELDVLVSSIEDRLNKAEMKVAWLKERKAMKEREITAARLI